MKKLISVILAGVLLISIVVSCLVLFSACGTGRIANDNNEFSEANNTIRDSNTEEIRFEAHYVWNCSVNVTMEELRATIISSNQQLNALGINNWGDYIIDGEQRFSPEDSSGIQALLTKYNDEWFADNKLLVALFRGSGGIGLTVKDVLSGSDPKVLITATTGSVGDASMTPQLILIEIKSVFSNVESIPLEISTERTIDVRTK